MMPVSGAHKHISIFISHCVENNDEARQYQEVLSSAGFDAFQYGHDLHSGDHIIETLSKRIQECDFFLFIVSDCSLHSDWVQRELGLAAKLREESEGFHPAIIPIYAREASWRRTHQPPVSFPVRDFNTNSELPGFDLRSVRGLDKHANPEVDTDDFLISQMTPMLMVSRKDYTTERVLHSTNVFTLYERLFPEQERDSNEDIVEWIFHSDLGKTRQLKLPGGEAAAYILDSRLYIMTLADRAIGLSFITYDATSKLVYGNYIAVEKSWRSGDLATSFFKAVIQSVDELFPAWRGVVFEVEKFDREILENTLAQFDPQTRSFNEEAETSHLRKALRVVWYQKIGCRFFLDKATMKPIECRSPCLAPDLEAWGDQEDDYWLMWYPKPDEARICLKKRQNFGRKPSTAFI